MGEGDLLENKELLFGTRAMDAGKQQNKFLLFMRKMFTMQRVTFWIITYAFAIGCFYLFGESFMLIAAVNTLLFPFAVILVGYFARLFSPSVPFIFRVLYPDYTYLYQAYSTLVFIVLMIVKTIIYMFLWGYSFALGLLGLVLTIFYASKLVK